VRLSALERTGDDQHGLDGSQTPIIMGCLRKEIATEEVEHCELCGESLGLDETFSHEHVFANELEIWNDDSDGSEEGLKTFWEFGTTEIAGVHGNEGTAGGVETNFVVLEEEALLAFLDGVKYSLELDCTHREHFGYESVELIEATPGAGSSETLEDTAETLVIHLI